MNNKPRIFINIHYLEIGGAERALLGLLNTIDTSRVKVDLFINQHTGEFMNLIPDKINLISENRKYSTLERPIISIIKEGHIDIAIARLIAKAHHWFYKTFSKPSTAIDMSIFQYVAKYTTPLLPSLRNLGEYDLAISFLTPHNIVAKKVKAKKKLAWIHTDYSTIHINSALELPVWSEFDHIISISPEVTKAFTIPFPTLRERIIEVENILSPTFIHQQANEYFPHEYNCDVIKICSVGRFCHAKNYDNIPFIAKRLKEKGLKFKWFIIGFGDTALVQQNIFETETNDCVILTGKKINPYPYIKYCDIYAQPSRYEGKSVTVKEAQILCKPVIITNYPTAKSQINHNIDGIICECDNKSIANAIYDLANDNSKRDKISQYLASEDYGNEDNINSILSLVI